MQYKQLMYCLIPLFVSFLKNNLTKMALKAGVSKLSIKGQMEYTLGFGVIHKDSGHICLNLLLQYENRHRQYINKNV